jgi:hypothetical protein
MVALPDEFLDVEHQGPNLSLSVNIVDALPPPLAD